jgi:hypothetical protein
MRPKKPMTNRRGSILLYSVYLAMMMCVLISVAVDYGRMQIIKTEAQRCADNTAMGVLQACLSRHTEFGYSTAAGALEALTPTLATPISAANPVDPGSGINATVVPVWGSWYGSPASFHPNDATGPYACKVTVSRTVANGNPVPFIFPFPTKSGFLTKTQNITATAVGLLPNPVILLNNGTVASTGDPWLMGMTSGGASYDDVAGPYPTGQSPTPYTVIPGSTLTFTSVTGKVNHLADTNVATDGDGPDGSAAYWHMKDPPTGAVAQGSGEENGVADLSAPIDSFIGVFGDGVAPNDPSNSSYANPAMRSATTDMSQSGINDLVIQQPFYIGDGTNNSGSAQTFLVPGNANQLYLGIMDGYQWHNNVGSFSVGKLTEQPPVQIVQ